MRMFLYRLTGWRLLAPGRTPWGESTALWTDVDWNWYRQQPGRGDLRPIRSKRPL